MSEEKLNLSMDNAFDAEEATPESLSMAGLLTMLDQLVTMVTETNASYKESIFHLEERLYALETEHTKLVLALEISRKAVPQDVEDDNKKES